MAKGDGGGGHYDERRRAAAAKPKTFKADSPEVLRAIQKPKSKPVVVVKKKKPMPMAKPRKLSDINLGGPKPSLKYRDIVNREPKEDFWDGSIGDVNRYAKGDLGGEMVNRYARSRGDLGGQVVNEYASSRGDREPDNTGSLFGFLRDPSDVPLTSRLRRRV